MKHCSSKKFIINNSIFSCSEFKKTFPDIGISIYEVIRLYDGKPLFFEDHYSRLLKSAELTGLTVKFKKADIFDKISSLVKENKMLIGNIRIVFNEQELDGRKKHKLILSFIKHRYPKADEIVSGVIANTVKAERLNPNAKTINTKLRSVLDRIIKKSNIYETIMVDQNDFITEGSRSNVFFIKNNILYTSPISDVLPGITRKKIISICENIGVPLLEVRICMQTISSFDAAFISGTSPWILPLKQIDHNNFKADHPVLISISEEYDKILADYLQSRLLTTQTTQK